MKKNTSISVRPIQSADSSAWLELRLALWPEGSRDEHAREIERFFAGDFPRSPWAVFLAVDGDGRVLGLAELSVRPYAEGCRSNRVGYLEGWYVRPEARGRGVGQTLVDAAEDWARSLGCDEFASDADPENKVSAKAHLALGFEDAGHVRCFRKDL